MKLNRQFKKNLFPMNTFMTAVLLGSMTFASCQDDINGNDISAGKKDLIVSNDAADFVGRVTMFNTADAVAYATSSENTAVDMKMPEKPAYPTNAMDMSDKSFNPTNVSQGNGETFIIKEGDTLEFETVQLRNAKWYVYGDLTIKECKGRGTIYLMESGRLDRNNGQDINYVNIYNYGGIFDTEREDLNIHPGFSYMTTGDLELPGTATVFGNLYVGGNLRVKTLTMYGGKVHVEGTTEVETKVDAQSKSHSYFQGSLEVGSFFTAQSNSIITTMCSAKVGTLTMNNSKFNVCASLSADNTALKGSANLWAEGGAYLSLGALDMAEKNSHPVIHGNGGATHYAVVEANTIKAWHNDMRTVLTGHLGLHYTEMSISNDKPLEVLGQIKINEADDTVIPEDDCNPGFTPGSDNEDGGNEDGGNESKVIIEHIAQVTSPDHEHGISATCIQIVGNKAYVSYHQRGADYSGCVEVFNINSDTDFSLVSYMRSVENRDFNHLIVEDNNLYAAGGEKKGGYIMNVPLGSDGRFSETSADRMTVTRLNGGDGNCLIKNEENFIVASTWGFESFDADWNKQEDQQRQTAGSAKHIDSNGTKYVTLNLAARGVESAKTEISVYDGKTLMGSDPDFRFTADNITPTDGKNVCKLDADNNVYVCLGQNGFKLYSTAGRERGSFKLEGSKAAVNGVDFDDKYIYLAYGGKGLYILDKKTLKEVASYKYAGGKSANYVKVAGDYIYVAYGESGIQLFKLVQL